MSSRLLALLFVSVVALNKTSAQFYLLKDINRQSEPSVAIIPQIQWNGALYFAIEQDTLGVELWKLNAGSTTPTLVADLFQSGSSSPRNFLIFQNRLFFFANDGRAGVTLFETDGSTAGTRAVYGNISISNRNPLISVGDDAFYFVADGKNIWQSDGTPLGTNIVFSSENTSVEHIAAWKEGVAFTTANLIDENDDLWDKSVWIANGSTPFLIKQFINNSLFGVTDLCTYDDGIYFTYGNFLAPTLWHYNGATNTSASLVTTGLETALKRKGSNLFITYKDATNNAIHLKSTHTGSASIISMATFPALPTQNISHDISTIQWKDNTAAYFTYSNQLWKIDESQNTVLLVIQVSNAFKINELQVIDDSNFAYISSEYFSNSDSIRYKVWKKQNNTVNELRNFAAKNYSTLNKNSVSINLATLGNSVYTFSQNNPLGNKCFDKLEAQSATINLQCYTNRLGNSNASAYTPYGSKVFFFANDGTGTWVYKTTGQKNSAEQVYRLSENAQQTTMSATNSALFFAEAGQPIIRYDGSNFTIVNVNEPIYTNPKIINAIDNTIYFTGEQFFQTGLYKYDGQQPSVLLLNNPFTAGQAFTPPIKVSNRVLFFNTYPTPKLYRVETAGVTELKAFSTLSNFKSTLFNSETYFVASDATSGTELWKSNGTSNGTRVVRDIHSGIANSNIKSLIADGNNWLYFIIQEENVSELWRTNGNENATLKQGNIFTNNTQEIKDCWMLSGTLIIQTESANSINFWRWDAGAQQVQLLNSHLRSDVVGDVMIVGFGEKLIYLINDVSQGYQIWQTDGTISGSFLTIDLAAGIGQETDAPYSFAYINNQLFITLKNDVFGYEPHVIVPQNVALPVELAKFTATPTQQKTVDLQWVTTTERNNKGFEVQRSLDGVRWMTIGFFAGKGTSFLTNYYSLEDLQPYPTTNYYRLRQYDMQGNSTLSPTEIVSFRNEQEIFVYPNPAETSVNIQLINIANKGEVSIYNAVGQLVYRAAISDSYMQADISRLPKGVYIIEVAAENNFYNKIFVKN
ncbi:MAG: T9SS type A sorting domain-containing protein [Saprospiraceae bacterium]|nr:T9SS type A sorting domain-containing protein [Saprospiraceae bacterium]